MNLHSELLRQARHLATKEPRRPLQASLRRAVSAAYYALYHLLVDDAVRRMVAAHRHPLRDCLRRAFDHGTMRRVAQQFAASSVAPRLRHEADYNTAWRSTRPDALGLIEQTEAAFACWRSVRRTPQADTFLIGLLVYDKLRG